MQVSKSEIRNALKATNGDIEAASKLLDVHASVNLKQTQAFLSRGIKWVPGSVRWYIPDGVIPNRYRLTRMDKIENRTKTRHVIKVDTPGKPSIYTVYTATRSPWPYGDLDWIMAVRPIEDAVYVISDGTLSPGRIKGIAEEIQAGLDAHDIAYATAFRVKNVTVPHRINRVPQELTPYMKRYNLAMELIGDIFDRPLTDTSLYDTRLNTYGGTLAFVLYAPAIERYKDVDFSRLSLSQLKWYRHQMAPYIPSEILGSLDMVTIEEALMTDAKEGDRVDIKYDASNWVSYSLRHMDRIDDDDEDRLMNLKDATISIFSRIVDRERILLLRGRKEDLTEYERWELALRNGSQKPVLRVFKDVDLNAHPEELPLLDKLIEVANKLMQLFLRPVLITNASVGHYFTQHHRGDDTKIAMIPTRMAPSATLWMMTFFHEYGHFCHKSGRYGISDKFVDEIVTKANELQPNDKWRLIVAEAIADSAAPMILPEFGIHRNLPVRAYFHWHQYAVFRHDVQGINKGVLKQVQRMIARACAKIYGKLAKDIKAEL